MGFGVTVSVVELFLEILWLPAFGFLAAVVPGPSSMVSVDESTLWRSVLGCKVHATIVGSMDILRWCVLWLDLSTPPPHLMVVHEDLLGVVLSLLSSREWGRRSIGRSSSLVLRVLYSLPSLISQDPACPGECHDVGAIRGTPGEVIAAEELKYEVNQLGLDSRSLLEKAIEEEEDSVISTADESVSSRKVISTADESVSSRKDISTVDESINSRHSRSLEEEASDVIIQQELQLKIQQMKRSAKLKLQLEIQQMRRGAKFGLSCDDISLDVITISRWISADDAKRKREATSYC
ncbi:hypothetical protein F511_42211 [Dorcoceras hygrometricum]|uniref:Uncharacterized protein n=1 Tax=Dorcoceras hygrometricum TaxID=472368 RepID=A0A2Z7C0N8_9LAMI|nr:hypothetical protein F511_42211 [Dorcoceras hygrometricum]